MRSVQNTETCWGNVRQLLSVFLICGNARARSPGPGPGLGFSHWERQLVGNPNFLQEEVGGPLGGLRRGLPLSPPSVVGFPPRRADFPRMIWKVVPSSYRFLLCGVSRQRPPPSRCGSAGCLALAASFLSSAWVFPLCCGTPRQQETQTYEGPQNGAGLLEHDLSVYLRSQLVLRPRLHRYDLHCGPFFIGDAEDI